MEEGWSVLWVFHRCISIFSICYSKEQLLRGNLDVVLLPLLRLALLRRVSADVLEGTEDVRWDWWGSGHISTAGPVTVLIGHPGEFVQLSLRVIVLGQSVGYMAALSALRVCDSVWSLVAVGIGTIIVHVTVLAQDGGISVDVASWGSGCQEEGDGQLGNRIDKVIRIGLLGDWRASLKDNSPLCRTWLKDWIGYYSLLAVQLMRRRSSSWDWFGLSTISGIYSGSLLLLLLGQR